VIVSANPMHINSTVISILIILNIII